MKKLITLMFALLCLAACGGDDEKIIQQDEVVEEPMFVSYSFDKKYKLSVYREKIRFYEGTELIWENPIEKVSMEVDLGYGEPQIIECPFGNAFFFPDSYNVYAVYYKNPYMCYYFYNIKGNLTNRVHIKASALLEQKCPWNESLRIVQTWPNDGEYEKGITYYQTFDENGNNEIYQCIENISDTGGLHFDGFKKIPGTNLRYVNSQNLNILFISVNEDEKKITIDACFDLGKFIRDSYPEETNAPRYSIADFNVEQDTTVLTIDVTFYSGEKEQLKITIDNQTGNIVQ